MSEKLKKISNAPFKYSIGDQITSNGRNFEIIDKEYRTGICNKKPRTQKFYKCKCSDCGNEFWFIEYRLGDTCKDQCPICGTKYFHKLIPGVNDLETTMPKIAALLKDREVARFNTKHSKNVATFICPDCGREIHKKINTVCVTGHLNCSCGDSWSYPNKFLYSLLEQSNVDFKSEKDFEWSNGRRYDGYAEVNNKKVIIEMNGAQHYGARFYGVRSPDEEKLNDAYKQEIALLNGIDYYYSIDCCKSEMEYIKDSILATDLLNILGITPNDIDWVECDRFATSNFCKMICDYYNEHEDMSAKEIAEVFKIGRKSCARFLNKGATLNWCSYNPREKSSANASKRSKSVYCENLDMTFRNAMEAAIFLGANNPSGAGRSIRKSIEENRKYFDYKFRYVS